MDNESYFALEALIDDVHAKERTFFQDYGKSMRDFVQKGETNHSELFATRQEQIQAKLNSICKGLADGRER